MRVYLTGFMGSGKTTAGRLLAGKLGFPFYDLDSEIERKESLSVADIFQNYGEARFREMESKSLQSIMEEPAVIATGGGCFFFNEQWMLQNGLVVYLQVPYEQLCNRIGADPNRPLWHDAKKLFQERQDQYLKAHFVVDASKDPESIAARIKELVSGR